MSDFAKATIAKTAIYGLIMLQFISQVPTVALPPGTQEQSVKFTLYKIIINLYNRHLFTNKKNVYFFP